MTASFSGWKMLAAQWVQRELWQPLKPIPHKKAEHWCITLQHNYGPHSDKTRGAAIMEHICQENLLVIWVIQMTSPDYLDKNKQALFCTTNLGSLSPLFTRKRGTGKKQVGSPAPVQGTLQTQQCLKKSQDIAISFSLLSTGQEEKLRTKKKKEKGIKQNLEAILQMCPVPHELNTLLLASIQSTISRLNFCGKKETFR